MIKFAEIYQNLDPNLVFSKIGEIVKKQKQLYHNYIEIDELFEINRDWRTFSEFVVEHLLYLNDFISSLFDRMIDEVERKPKPRNQKDSKMVKSITSFWLDITLMSYLYASIAKYGVLDEENRDIKTLGDPKTSLHLDKIVVTAFAKPEFFTEDTHRTITKILKLDQIRKNLLIHSDMEEEKLQFLAKYDQSHAEFLLQDIRVRISDGAVSWWWKDPIAMFATVQMGVNHLETMKALWGKSSSEFLATSMDFYQITQSQMKLLSGVYYSQHYITLGEEALKNGDMKTASAYFEQAAQIIKSRRKKEMELIDFADNWTRFTVQEQYITTRIAEKLCKVANESQTTIKHIQAGNFDKVKERISATIEKVSTVISAGDLPYISSVAFTIETILVYIRSTMENRTKFDGEEVIAFAQNRITSILDRLKNATRIMTDKWVHSIRTDSENIEHLTILTKNLPLLKLSILVLPIDLQEKTTAVSQLEAIAFATDAIKTRTEANAEFGTNPVKDLLMRAKSFHLTNDALECCKDETKTKIEKVLNEILYPLAIDSLLRGLIAEVQLKVALLQYTFVNKMVKIIEYSTLSGVNAINTKYNVEQLSIFQDAIKAIILTVQTLLNYKAPIVIKKASVNWNYFATLFGNMDGLAVIIELLQNSMIALQPRKLISKSNAIKNWRACKQLAYKAAEKFSANRTEDGKKHGEILFGVANFFTEIEDAVDRKAKTPDFPLEHFLDLVHKIVMGS